MSSEASSARFQPHDEAMFGGTKMTLLERRFELPGQTPMWVCCETDDFNASLRLVCEDDLQPVESKAAR